MTRSPASRAVTVLLSQVACFCVAFVLPATNASAADASVFKVRSLKEIRERAVVIQKFDNSCAAAALATVFTYGLQHALSERYVAAKMLESTEPAKVKARGGFSFLDMKHFVEAIGYRAEAYQYLSLEDLKLFRAPIVPIQVRGIDHYVIVNAVNSGQVLLADPAFGNRTMPVARFSEVWVDGLALVVTVR